MITSPLDIARDFERANGDNGVIDLCNAYGREMADVWIMNQPAPWSESEIDAFSDLVTKTLLVVLEQRLPSRADRRRFRSRLTMVQGVALVAALDRIKQHALSGFVGGSA